MKKHLITGATGELGRALQRAVRERGAAERFALGARRPDALDDAAGMEIRRVDYDAAESMDAAFRDVDTLVLISSNAANEMRKGQHAAAIAAAKRAGVERIVYTSVLGADAPSGNPLLEVHHETEARLAESGIAHVSLRNGIYLDSVPGLVAGYAEAGVVAHPAGDGKVAWITRADIAAFTLDVVLDAAVRGVLDVVPPESASLAEVVRAVSARTGKPIDYAQPTEAEYIETLLGFGLPKHVAEIFAQVCRGIRDGKFDVTGAGFEQRLGRRPQSLAEYVAEAFPAA